MSNRERKILMNTLYITLLTSAVINYYISFKHKQLLIEMFSEQFYYQFFITWLSLVQPAVIGIGYRWVRILKFKVNRYFVNKKAAKIGSKLTGEAKAKLEMMNDDVANLEEEIERLNEEQNLLNKGN